MTKVQTQMGRVRSDERGVDVSAPVAAVTPARGYAAADSASRVPPESRVVAPAPTRVNGVSQAESRLIDRLNAFALQRLTTGTTCAPSYLGFFGPLLYGATEPQADRVLHALGLDGLSKAQVQEAIQNLLGRTSSHIAIWARADFTVDKDFAAIVEAKLDVPVLTSAPADLKAKVDSWSFGATHGRIVDLVPEGSFEKSQLAVASAFALDPTWVTAFDPKRTKTAEFTTTKGAKVQLPMMAGEIDCQACATEDYRAAKIPLDGGLSFVMVVPNEGVSLEKVTADLMTPRDSRGLLARMKQQTGTVRLPRLVVQTRRDAADVLSPELRGPYDAIGSRPVTLDAAIEKWLLRLDETGLTSGAGVGAHFAASPSLVEGDRPFIYLVREEATGLFLATGIYDGPG